MGTLCAVLTPVWAQIGCNAPASEGGPSWNDVRQTLEQRVLEAPTNAQGKLALAQYLTYCDGTRREGILQLTQLAPHATVGATALESWRQALAWVESDASSVPLFRAYLRLRPQDRQIRAQLETLESGGLLAGNRTGTAAPVVPVPVQRQSPLANSLQEKPLPIGEQAYEATNFEFSPMEPARMSTPVWPAAAQPKRQTQVPSAWDTTPTPTAPAALPRSLQGRIQAVRADIQDIEQQRGPEFSIGTLVRTRQGESGMSRLVDTEVPIELKLDVGDGKLALRLTPALLHAGSPASTRDVLSRFGAGPVNAWQEPLTSAGAQQSTGLGLGMAYEGRNWQVDVGTTPLGFRKTGISAGVRYRQAVGQALQLDAGLSRRPVRDSVLSFAGMHDARTGVTWGGVAATGGRLGLTWDNGELGFYGYGAAYRLTGTEVARNSKMELGAGAYYHVVQEEEQKLVAGLALTALKYKKNLRYFTYGHGGYFSPQQFAALAFPVQWQERVGRLRYTLKASLGVQSLREDRSPLFPTNTALQVQTEQFLQGLPPELQNRNTATMYSGQRKTGIGYSLSGAWEYQLQPKLWLGGVLGLDNARDYRQFTGGLYLRYAFQPSERLRSLPLTPWRSPYDYDTD